MLNTDMSIVSTLYIYWHLSSELILQPYDKKHCILQQSNCICYRVSPIIVITHKPEATGLTGDKLDNHFHQG